jgi:hypothetical protein
LDPLKSLGVIAALALGVVTPPVAAAPGAFTLTGTPACSLLPFPPAIVFQWTPSSGATSYELIRDDGQHTAMTVSPFYYSNYYYYMDVVLDGPARSYFARASDGTATTDSNTITVASPATGCVPLPDPIAIAGKAICYPGNPQRVMSPGVELDWHAARLATSYDIYRDGAFVSTVHSGGDVYTYIAVLQSEGFTTMYYVVAKNSAGASTSNTVEIIIPADICVTEPPVPVLSGSATCNTISHVPSVALNWTPVGVPVGWQLFRNGVPYAVPQGIAYSDTNVEPGHTYTYNVSTNALSAPLSNRVTVTVPDTICTLEVHSPNLVALAINLSTLSARAGDTITVSIDVTNGGDADALPATARIRFGRGPTMSPSDSLLGTITLPVLASGATIQRTMNVKLPSVAAGTYRLFVSLDEEHASGDVHFSDNVKASDAISLADMIPPKRRAATH